MIEQPLTRSRQQYLETKAQHPDAILFFRLGDFYEMFDDDAETASRELDLVLTARHQRGESIPMCGVPHHAAEGYIAKLLSKGYKVALCEQTSSEPINGLMPREVVRVFTAGTVIEPGMLEAGRNNYLVAVVRVGELAGLAYADITTGEFATTSLNSYRALTDELARLEPAELVVTDIEHSLGEYVRTVTHHPTLRFEESYARQTLLRHFQVQTLAAFGCDQNSLAIRAAGGLLSYLLETQRGAIHQLQSLKTYHLDGYMSLDKATRRSLELTESLAGERGSSLFQVLNKTVTPMGARLLRDRLTRPLLDIPALERRLDEIDAFVQSGMARGEMRQLLRRSADLERLTTRVVSGKATPKEVEQIALTLDLLPSVQKVISSYPQLYDLGAEIDTCESLNLLIKRAIADEAPNNFNKIGVIKEGYSAELDGVMKSSRHARDYINNLEASERERTGIDTIKVGFNKVFGYYIEISRGKSHLAPENYIRKQTLVNAERYITPEMKEYETLILNAEESILELERRLFNELCVELTLECDRLLQTAAALAKIDVAAALADVAINHGYVRPKLSYEVELSIREGRHPMVERSFQVSRFVPNNLEIGRNDRIHLITGPNMAGKSTFLRQTALITLMAQIGSYVPAFSATIGLVDRIFTRIGAHDDLFSGRSTFMVEMVESAEILHHATPRSLLILDEIGRGTSTYDGLSIAWAMIEYLHNHPRLKPRTLFATHYHELVTLADTLPMVTNYNVVVSEEGENIVFLHHIAPGSADRSYGIHVAQLAGLPRDLITRANELLERLEKNAPAAITKKSRPKPPKQPALFSESSPLQKEIEAMDVLTMTPLQALNKLYEWKRQYGEKKND